MELTKLFSEGCIGELAGEAGKTSERPETGVYERGKDVLVAER